MKLKYYLRGVGIGIIFATLVMTLSCVVHNYNLSDQYIIKEAMKLGMVMKDDLNSEDDLWGGDDTEEDTAAGTEVGSENTDSTQVAGSEAETSEKESESESASESESQSESESTSQEPVTSETPSETYVTIVIERGDYARQVAEKLFAAGLVQDAEEFRVYVGNHGYGKSIRVGTFSIPVGASYEEICKIITTKP